jgi:precorrin-6B methylase 1
VLTVVGTGIDVTTQLTPGAQAAIEAADAVPYLVADPIAALRLEALNSNARSLDSLYAAGKDRLQTYEEMADAFLEPARSGFRSCAVLYGHPGVFGFPAHAAVEQARAEGIPARMLPAVSALDCLFADLGIDPGSTGLQCYEATYFVERRLPVDRDATLVLLQVGMIGERGGDPTPAAAGRFRQLVEQLAALYGSAREAVLYTASTYPGASPTIARFKLGEPPPRTPDLAATLCIGGSSTTA